MRQWRRAVSIGEDLAEARRRAGLTVTEVGRRTRIRETIIRSIERDDYRDCGSDFYARGHIRAIARAVGTDPEPLIREYEVAHPATQPTAAELLRPEQPAAITGPPHHARAAALALALAAIMAVLAIAAYHLIHGANHAGSGPVAAGSHHAHPSQRPPEASPAPSPAAALIDIHLTAIQDCWIEFTTPAGKYLFQAYVIAGTSRNWTFRHAVDMRLGNPAGTTLTVNGTNPLPPGTTAPITLRIGRHGKIAQTG